MSSWGCSGEVINKSQEFKMPGSMYNIFWRFTFQRNFILLCWIEWATNYAELRVALFSAILWAKNLLFDSNKAHWVFKYTVFINKRLFIVYRTFYSFTSVNNGFLWLDCVAKYPQKSQRTSECLLLCNSHVFNKRWRD